MKKILLLTCIVSFLLFFSNIQSRDFWAPDEGDFAQVVKELSTDVLVPHLNGQPYSEKPPLFYYMNFLSAKAFSFLKDEVSMRIPTALLALLAAVLFASFLYIFFGRDTALTAVLILVTSPLYYWQARFLQVDMAFAAFVASSLLCFFWFFLTGKKPLYMFAFIFAALAFMTKGPLALILITPVVFIYGLLQKDLRIFWDRWTLVGIGIFLIIVVPWYLSVYLKEGFPFFQENIIRQNLTRFFEAWSHKRPFYYYFTTLPLDFFPWSLFLPLGIYHAIKDRGKDRRTIFFLIWFLWMFLFFSLSSGKISKYILPLLPAMALMTTQAFGQEKSRYIAFSSLFLPLLFLAMGVTVVLYKPGLYREFYPERLFIGVMSVLLALSLWAARSMKKTDMFPFFLGAFLFVVYMTANISIYDKMNRYKSPRPFSAKVRAHIQDNGQWVYYGSMRGVYIYYVGRQAIHVDEHRVDDLRRLREKMGDFYLVTRKRDLGEVREALGRISVVIEEKVGETPMVLAHYGQNGG